MTDFSDIKKILITREELEETVKRLSEALNTDYKNKEVILVLILKGSFVFCADLIRMLSFPVLVEMMKVSSYGTGTVSTGKLRIDLDIKTDIAGKDVLIVEDIIDSGNTLSKLKGLLESRDAASVRICTLLDKPERRETDVTVEYTGIQIPDEFVVGYGLDYNERYRELPYIGILDEKVYA